eukprot:1160850-Pelagomonas_calceolata.AAC.8
MQSLNNLGDVRGLSIEADMQSLKCVHMLCWQALVHTVLLRSNLGGVHGIPKVHYKGRQGDYYIMVRVREMMH